MKNNKINFFFRFVLWILALNFILLLIFRFSPAKEISSFENRKYSLVFTDSEGSLLCVYPSSEGPRRQYVSVEKIPVFVQKSFIKAEDSRFYFHNGIDVFSVCRAFFQNRRAKRTVSGASTITMQTAGIMLDDYALKNDIARKTGLKRKVAQGILAWKLEARFSKKEILELYLNNVPFGGNTEGVMSGSLYYFGKPVYELTETESVLLSVIPRRPVSFNPHKNPENCAKASFRVNPKIPYETYKLTAVQSGLYNPKSWPQECYHLCESMKNQTQKENGRNLNPVALAVNLNVQKLCENEFMSAFETGEEFRIKDGACVVLENKTGKVISYYGGRQWIDGCNVKNQMGSSMKPFLYALALEKNIIEPSTVLNDSPFEFGESDIYSPQNFNNRCNGPVMARYALASSLNIPAVWLCSKVGVADYANFLETIGFESLANGKGFEAGLSLALGGGEVTILELVRGFSVFPNDGNLISLNFFDDKKEPVLEKIISSDSTRIICDFLSDNSARTLGFGFWQSFQTDYPSIFKTGTSNQYQNIVAVGATPEYTVGVWMGNFDGNTVVGKTGSSLPAQIAKNILDYLTQNKNEGFLMPEKYEKREVCSLSGKKPSKYCSGIVQEFFQKDEADILECSWHREGKNGRKEIHLPAEYQLWNSNIGSSNVMVDYSTEPLQIIVPNNKSKYYMGTRDSTHQMIPVQVTGGLDDCIELEVSLDEKNFMVNRPFMFSVPVTRGEHTLIVKSGSETDSVHFIVE